MCIIAVRENLPLHNNYQKAKGGFLCFSMLRTGKTLGFYLKLILRFALTDDSAKSIMLFR